MKIKIFDYKGDSKIVDLGEKEILLITVKEVSGDEVLVVRYKDGTRKCFDSSDSRIMSFDDGEYDIIGDNITKFLNERKA